MAQLLFTTDAFAPHGLARPGAPLLLDGEMRLIEPACAWLLHVALVRGRTRSPETWRTYDWWQTLGANGWGWNEVGLAEVAAYRDRMLSGPSDRTGRPFARSTINGRIRTLTLFYRWCVNAGLIERAPFAANELATFRSRPQGFLAHVRRSAGPAFPWDPASGAPTAPLSLCSSSWCRDHHECLFDVDVTESVDTPNSWSAPGTETRMGRAPPAGGSRPIRVTWGDGGWSRQGHSGVT